MVPDLLQVNLLDQESSAAPEPDQEAPLVGRQVPPHVRCVPLHRPAHEIQGDPPRLPPSGQILVYVAV